jgi:microcystin-dependent protein/uncharacterized protein (UPF0333 family)
MFDIDFNIIKDLILLFLVIAVIYLLVNNKHSENFDTSTDIKAAVSTQYGIDLDAMRNLGDIANKILSIDPLTQNMDTLNLPANLTTIKNLKVSGSVNFTEKDSNIMEIFPRYMILAWATDDSFPLGWKLCDGKKYYKTIEGTFTEITLSTLVPSGADIIATPDLRGRFILGSGVGAKDMNGNSLSERKLNDNGGAENHILTEKQMPIHSHGIQWLNVMCNGDNCGTHGTSNIGTIIESDKGTGTRNLDPLNMPHSTNNNGENEPHNNMPPYYVLTYIMKL